MTNVTSYRKQGVEISESKLGGKSRNGAAGYIYADCSIDIGPWIDDPHNNRGLGCPKAGPIVIMKGTDSFVASALLLPIACSRSPTRLWRVIMNGCQCVALRFLLPRFDFFVHRSSGYALQWKGLIRRLVDTSVFDHRFVNGSIFCE